jgi:hypothetical protein
MAYADIYNAANDEAIFQPRCVVAMWTAATNIQNEDAGTQDHALRLDWANKVLRGQVTIPYKVLAALVLQNATIAANPGAALDSDIQFQVNSIIPTLIAIG